MRHDIQLDNEHCSVPNLQMPNQCLATILPDVALLCPWQQVALASAAIQGAAFH